MDVPLQAFFFRAAEDMREVSRVKRSDGNPHIKGRIANGARIADRASVGYADAEPILW